MKIPRFDIRLWCQECGKVIGTVHNVADNNPGDRVGMAMRGHVLEAHGDLLRG
jgi:hypothetical protein